MCFDEFLEVGCGNYTGHRLKIKQNMICKCGFPASSFCILRRIPKKSLDCQDLFIFSLQIGRDPFWHENVFLPDP